MAGNYYTPFSVRIPDELLEKVNTALQELKEDGTLQKIVDKYIPAE